VLTDEWGLANGAKGRFQSTFVCPHSPVRKFSLWPAPVQCCIAARLRLSENALHVALFRLRQRFREQIRAEVAATGDSPEEVAAELRHLMQVVLASGASA